MYVNISEEYEQLTRKAASAERGDIVIIVAGNDGVKDTMCKGQGLLEVSSRNLEA